jgi:arginase family enzyme
MIHGENASSPPDRARFGPNGIRQGSRRILTSAVNVPWKTTVTDHADVVDCGDVRMSSSFP